MGLLEALILSDGRESVAFDDFIGVLKENQSVIRQILVPDTDKARYVEALWRGDKIYQFPIVAHESIKVGWCIVILRSGLIKPMRVV